VIPPYLRSPMPAFSFQWDALRSMTALGGGWK
jgi:hypothetical protein